MTSWFVTGTDTGIGKTWVSVALLHALKLSGRTAIGMKPIASGCERTSKGLRNEDAVQLLQASMPPVAYDRINPYAFEPPIAPHIAARDAGVNIDLDYLAQLHADLSKEAECVVVEGVGGWLVPLGPDLTVADLAVRLGLPVILVVGMRLGCLNHALLTAESIRSTGLPLAGWVANVIDPSMVALQENMRALENRLSAPFLGVIPYARSPDEAAQILDLAPLFPI